MSEQHMEINWLAKLIFDRKNLGKRNEMLKEVIKLGMDTNLYDKKGENLLHTFINRFVLENDPDAVDIAITLLNAGVPLDEPSKNDKEYTPLFFAIKRQNIELAVFIISMGADVNKLSGYEYSPLYYTFRKCYWNSEPEKALQLAKLMLSKGADINAKIYYDRTVLHAACHFEFEEIVSFLLWKGADITVVDEDGDTPFSIMHVESFENPSTFIMIKEIAKLKSFDDTLVNESDIKLIKSYPDLQKYFDECKNELSRMKKTNFYNAYSYWSILKSSKNNKKLAKLLRNENFVNNFEANSSFSIYKSDLQQIINEAIRVRDESIIVSSRLCSLFGNYFPDVVIRKLAESLNVEDLPVE